MNQYLLTAMSRTRYSQTSFKTALSTPQNSTGRTATAMGAFNRFKEKWGPHSTGGGRNLSITGTMETQARRKRRRAASSNHRAKSCTTPRSLKQLEVHKIAHKTAMDFSRPLHESV